MKCCLMMTWGRYSARSCLCLSVCRHAVVIAQFVFRLQTSSSTAIFWWSRWPPSHWWHRWHMYTQIETHIHIHRHTQTHTHKHTYMQDIPFLPRLYSNPSHWQWWSLCLACNSPYFDNGHQNQVHPTPYKGNQIHPGSCFSLSSPECPYILIISFRSL